MELDMIIDLEYMQILFILAVLTFFINALHRHIIMLTYYPHITNTLYTIYKIYYHNILISNSHNYKKTQNVTIPIIDTLNTSTANLQCATIA